MGRTGPATRDGRGGRAGPGGRGRVGPYFLSVTWLLGAVLAFLAPALSRGGQLGDFELLSVFGWGSRPGVPLHNVVSSDQIQEMVPWTDLSWVQVHAGHLPLWNPFAGLGLPLAFNFQSAAFSLPDAIAYLFPLHAAYTVTVVVKLLLAGTGVMFLCRVLRIPLVAATFAGTVYELSGSLTAWSGWPQTGVFCWLGWIAGAAALMVRSRQPWRRAPLLALFVGLSILGGHPESIAIELSMTVLFALVLAGVHAARDRGLRRVVVATGSLAGGVLAGALLASPLLLPGMQVVSRSSHTSSTGYTPLPHTNVVNLALATFYGLPVLHRSYFGSRNYYEAAGYVGIGTLLLAGLAVAVWWRRAEVIALLAVALASFLLVFSSTVAHVMSHLPVARLILWDRAIIPLDFCLAVLGGLGLQALSERAGERKVRIAYTALAAAGAVMLLGLWATTVLSGPSGQAHHERLASLIVPALQVATGLLVAAAMYVGARRHPPPGVGPARWGRWLALPVIAVETAFLLTATPSLWSSSPSGFAPTPAESTAMQAIGGARIGFQACPSLVQQPSLGVLAEANSAYGLDELAAYDPVVPVSWFRAWGAATGHPGELGINNFCASVATASLARQFGVSYIVGPPGAPRPAGSQPDGTIGGETVWRVPGSGLVTVGPAGAAAGAAETVVPYESPDPATIEMTLNTNAPSSVRFHLSNLPGWSATLDGRPATLRTWDRTMLSTSVPPGRHRIVLRYRPTAFVAGLWLCLATTLALIALSVLTGPLATGRRSRKAPSPQGDGAFHPVAQGADG